MTCKFPPYLTRCAVILLFFCFVAVSTGAQGKAAPRKAPSKTTPGTPDTSKRREAETEMLIAPVRFAGDRDIVAARKGFLKSIETDPTFPQPRYNLGVMAETENKKGEAIKWFTEYLTFDQKSRYAVAAKLKIARLQLPPDEKRDKTTKYNILISRANGFMRAGFLKEAVAELYAASAIDDQRWEAYAFTSVILSQEGKFTNAEKFHAEAKKRVPPDKQSVLAAIVSSSTRDKRYAELATRATGLYKQKKFLPAAEAYLQAWQTMPQRSEAGFAAVVAYTAAKEFVEAALILNRLKTNPDKTVAEKANRMLTTLTAKNRLGN